MGLLGTEVRFDRMTKVWMVLGIVSAIISIVLMGTTPETWISLCALGFAFVCLCFVMMRIESEDNQRIRFSRQ